MRSLFVPFLVCQGRAQTVCRGAVESGRLHLPTHVAAPASCRSLGNGGVSIGGPRLYAYLLSPALGQ